MILQRTDEWFAARRGKPTASEMWRLMAGNDAVNRFKSEKLAERMCGHFSNRADQDNVHIRRGIELEPEAIRAYEAKTGLLTTEGYWVDKVSWGCTPDAFVEEDGLLQVKCPTAINAIKTRYYSGDDWRVSQKEYYWQVMAEMAGTDRQWADVGIYCKEFADPDLWLYVKRIERDENAVAELLEKIDEFCRDLDDKCKPARKHDLVQPRPWLAEDDLERFLRA